MAGGFGGDHGMMPKRNSKTGKYDKPVARRNRSGGGFVALVIALLWWGILAGSCVFLWFLLAK